MYIGRYMAQFNTVLEIPFLKGVHNPSPHVIYVKEYSTSRHPASSVINNPDDILINPG